MLPDAAFPSLFIFARGRPLAMLHAWRLKRPRNVYYGWFIVAAALFSQLTAAAITSHAQAVFLKPMTHDLGWSRADFTWGQTIGTFVMSGAGFFVGNFLD